MRKILTSTALLGLLAAGLAGAAPALSPMQALLRLAAHVTVQLSRAFLSKALEIRIFVGAR
jgi:hypothetical protein